MALSSKKKRQYIAEIYERDGDLCFICGRELMLLSEVGTPDKGPLPDNYPTIEHVIPRVLGGGNALANLRVSCPDCNTKKDHSLKLDEDTVSKLSKGQLVQLLNVQLGANVALVVEAKNLRRRIEILQDEAKESP